MSYFKKSHEHKPKKGKGSYERWVEKFLTPIEDAPSLLCGPLPEKDDSSWREKYKGKTRDTDYGKQK